MAWSSDQFRERYGQLAAVYDPAMWSYRAVGMRITRYRQQAVDALWLNPGDTVVDLGCGTGLNFGFLQQKVGPDGRIIGVDLTPEMLAKAEARTARHGWENVELVEADMSSYHFPDNANGVLATLALATVPDYEQIVQRMLTELPSGARISNFELQWPATWPSWLARFAAWLNRPAGVTPDIRHRRPASSIEKMCEDVETKEVYFGAAYICAGTVPLI